MGMHRQVQPLISKRAPSKRVVYSPDLGDRIREIIDNKELNDIDIAHCLCKSKYSHISLQRFLGYLGILKNGYLYGRKQGIRGAFAQEYRSRLADVLYICDVSVNDGVIREIDKIDPLFKYPPENGISYSMMMAAYVGKDGCVGLVISPNRRNTVRIIAALDSANYRTIARIVRAVHEQQRRKSKERKQTV